ncbi:MAG: type II secretion system secretin GspD [Alphaproteobacteria bacterium]|nr:type II secretion system secretin GspD [Alphaproteobacteria bacterium]
MRTVPTALKPRTAQPENPPPKPEVQPAAAQPADRWQPQMFLDTSDPLGPQRIPMRPAVQESIGDISLNFRNADVREVARVVFTEILKVPFAVDARAQGSVTLQTSQPIDKASVLPILENALRLSGLSVVKTNEVYTVAPAADAIRFAPTIGRTGTVGGEPGYAIRVIPLRFTTVDEIQNLLRSIVPADTVVRTVPSRNVLIVAGSQRELANIADLVALFDTGIFKGMSFALFYPKNAEAKALVKDLDAIFGGEKSPTTGVVRFTVIERLNAILASSRTPSYLQEASTWIERLDQRSEAVDERLFVYNVQNGRASDLAATLTSVFGRKGADRGSTAFASAKSSDGPAALPSILAVPSAVPGVAVPVPFPVSPPPGAEPQDRKPLSAPGVGGEEGIRVAGTRVPQIIADENNNALLILTTPREYRVIEAALTKLDVPPLQVLIEAVVAEVTLTSDLRYGLQWFFQNGNFTNTLSNAANGAVSAVFPGYATVFSSGTNIRIVLDALASITTLNVLSSPQMMVLNNQTATLQVGDQVPIATQQATSVLAPGAPVVNTIQFRDTGVILKVTPRVNDSGQAQMEFSQEVSDVARTTTSGIDSPTIQQRKFNSTISVRSGETIALGGLIRDRRTFGNSGMPVLKEIPIVGNFFKTTTDTDARTELVVLITPRVVRSDTDIRRITDEFRERLRALTASEKQ